MPISNERREAAITTIRQGIADQCIYNADFEAAKDTLNRAFEQAFDLAQDLIRSKNTRGIAYEAYCLTGTALHLVPTYKKRIEKEGVKKLGVHAAATMLALFVGWESIAADLATVKQYIVKGKKPSATPRTTPERTLNNTGTCACCGQNCKLDGGKIVHHGFTIRYGWREGRCIGVGYDPVEVSAEGLHAYSKALIAQIAVLKEQIKDLDGTKLRIAQANHDEANREYYRIQERIMTWQAQPLPDQK